MTVAQAHAQCNYKIIAKDTTICQNAVTSFSIKPQPPSGADCVWDFGFQAVKNDFTPTLSFKTPGFHSAEVTLKLSNGNSCTFGKDSLVKVYERPIPGQIVTKAQHCHKNEKVELRSSAKNTKSYTWIIGTRSYKDTSSVIEHAFGSHGFQQVQMVLKGENNCITSHIFDSVTFIRKKPVVTLSADSFTICKGAELRISPSISYSDSARKELIWKMPGAAKDSFFNIQKPKTRYPVQGEYDLNLNIRFPTIACLYEYEWPKVVKVKPVPALNIALAPKANLNCQSREFQVRFNSDSLDVNNFSLTHAHADSLNINRSSHKLDLIAAKNGNYNLDIRYDFGACVSADSLSWQAKTPDIQTKILSDHNCFCDTPVLLNIAQNTSSTSPISSTKWLLINNLKDTLSTQLADSFVHTLKKLGDFKLFHFAQNDSACSAIDSFEFKIEEFELELSTENQVYCPGNELNVSIEKSSCFEKLKTTQWQLINSQNQVLASANTEKFNPVLQDTGYFHIKLSVENEQGCRDTVKIDSAAWVTQGDLIAIDSQSNVYCKGDTVTIPYTVQAGVENLSITAWARTATDSVEAEVLMQTDKIRFNSLELGVYDLQIIYTSSSCSDTITQKAAIKIGGVELSSLLDTLKNCIPFQGRVVPKIENNRVFGPSLNQKQFRWEALSNNTRVLTPNDRNATFWVNDQEPADLSLTVTNEQDCKETLLLEGIYDYELKARFSTADTSCQGVFLEAEESSKGKISERLWTLTHNSGAVLTKMNSISSAFHLDSLGEYKLRLRVKNDVGCTEEDSQQLYVVPFGPTFTVDTTTQCSPAFYTFKADGYLLDTIIWNFGDGNGEMTTTNKETIKIYDLTRLDSPRNIFSVSMVAKSKNACVDTIVKENLLRINAPFVDVDIINPVGCSPHTVQFENNSLNTARIYFNYGDSSSLDSISYQNHLYTVNGLNKKTTYKVNIIAQDKFGCTVEKGLKDSIEVYHRSVGRPSASNTEGCEPFSTILESNARFANTYNWQISTADSMIEDSNANFLVKLKSGIYQPQLILSNAIGCIDTFFMKDTIQVFPLPSASYILHDSVNCVGRETDLENTSSSATPVASYSWFSAASDSFTLLSKAAEPQLKFKEKGVYQIYLVVEDINGCVDSFSQADSLIIEKELNVDSMVLHYISIHGAELEASWSQVAKYAFEEYRLNYYENDSFVYFSNKANDTLATVAIPPKAGPHCYQIELRDKCDKIHQSKKHCTIALQVDKNDNEYTKLSWSPYIAWKDSQKYAVLREHKEKIDTLAILNATELNYIDSLVCDKKYHYSVLALHNNTPYKSKSNEVNHTISIDRDLSPAYLQLASVEDSAVFLSWERPNLRNIKSYIIERKELLQGGQFYRIAEADSLVFRDNSAQTVKTAYAYRVSAEDNCRNISNGSNEAHSIHLLLETLPRSYRLHWNAYKEWNKGISHYEVLRKIAPSSSFISIAQVGDRELSFNDTSAFLASSKNKISYKVLAIAKNASHKTDSSFSNPVTVEPLPSAYLATAFSPNGDGLNDEYKLKGAALNLNAADYADGNQVQIFNKWGQQVFYSTSLNEAWDGTFKGRDCPSGQYLVMLTVRALNGQLIHLTTRVSIIR